MGLVTNYPFALAAGMGMNSVVVSFALSRGLPWQQAMGVIVVEGLLIFILVPSSRHSRSTPGSIP
jgi:AGZA family xanthine/uracil permease-like MFS transporter